MLTIKYHSSFKKDYRRVVKRGYNIKLLEDIIKKLANGEVLPEKNKDHHFQVIILAVENVISHLIGCLYMRLIMEN